VERERRAVGLTGPEQRSQLPRQVRQAVPYLTRVILVVVIGWASGVIGLWQSGTVLHDRLSERTESPSGSVAYAAPVRQDEEATPTPGGGEFVVLPTEFDGTTPTATPFGAPQLQPASGPPPPPPISSPSPSLIPYTGDTCFGDEQVTFVPEDPRTNNELVVAVTSRYGNKYPRLAGTEKATFVRERPGQLGYVWEWTIQTTWPGQHEYVFYVDSTIPCKKVDVLVKRQYYTPTPKPTKTPKPDDADNDEGDSDNDEGN
jgi:hypothetical protein